MKTIRASQRLKPPTPLSSDAGHGDGPGRILLGVFEMFEQAAIPYCVLHGYESYPQRIKSDVDCIISNELRAGQLLGLFQQNKSRLGAEVVRYRNRRGHYLVLAGKNDNDTPCFVHLDLRVNYELDDRNFYDGRELLQSRCRHKQFWVPEAKLEFGCYLARRIAKGQLDDEQGERLSNLFQIDPAGCRQQIACFWKSHRAAL